MSSLDWSPIYSYKYDYIDNSKNIPYSYKRQGKFDPLGVGDACNRKIRHQYTGERRNDVGEAVAHRIGLYGNLSGEPHDIRKRRHDRHDDGCLAAPRSDDKVEQSVSNEQHDCTHCAGERFCHDGHEVDHRIKDHAVFQYDHDVASHADGERDIQDGVCPLHKCSNHIIDVDLSDKGCGDHDHKEDSGHFLEIPFGSENPGYIDTDARKECQQYQDVFRRHFLPAQFLTVI